MPSYVHGKNLSFLFILGGVWSENRVGVEKKGLLLRFRTDEAPVSAGTLLADAKVGA